MMPPMETIVAETWQIWITIAIIAAAVVSYTLDRAPIETTSLFVVAALMVIFYFFPVFDGAGNNLLGPTQILSGFANPALISVLALLVVGQGLFQTGALDHPARFVAELGASRPQLTVFLAFFFVAAISAFLNNTPVVVIFIPVLSTLANRLKLQSSKVMMPLSFACILGGMTTLIGSSTNLLAAGVAKNAGLPPIGFFDFFVPGAFLAGIGLLYTIFVAPKFLPDRSGMATEVAGASQGKQFIAQIQVTHGHPLVDVSAVAGLFPPLKDMTVRMIQRGEHPILPPFDNIVLRPGDDVILATTRQSLTEALTSRADILQGMIEERHAEGDGPDNGQDGEGGSSNLRGELTLAEVIVAPGSRMIGRNIEQIGFRRETGCIVLGIQRRSRMIRSLMSDIRLEAGDVLLVLGNKAEVHGLRANKDVVLLEWSATELPDRTLATRSLVIFAATVTPVIFGWVPIEIAAVAGATATIALGVLNVRQAVRAIDQRIFLLVGAALAMALALQYTGGAELLGHGVVNLFADQSPAIILSAFFLFVAVMTNLMSNNAAAVLFTPIAISTAKPLGIDPLIFVYGVIFAANCSYASPIGYQTNLLVMGPGHYEFRDFMKVGGPLVLIIWLVYSFLAPWYYGL